MTKGHLQLIDHKQSVILASFAFVMLAGTLAVWAGTPSVFGIAVMTLSCTAVLLRAQGYLLSPSSTMKTHQDSVDPVSVMLWAFVLRMATGLLFALVMIADFGYPFFGRHDDWSYEEFGNLVAAHGVSTVSYMRQPGYPIFVGFFHRVADHMGGYSFLVPRVVNAGIGALLAALIVQMAQMFGATRRRQFLLALVCIGFPDFLYYSSMTLRDIIIAYLWMLGLAAMVSRRPMMARVLVLVGVVAILFPLRVYYAMLLGIVVIGSLVVNLRRYWPSRVWLSSMLVFSLGLGVVLTYQSHTVGPRDSDFWGEVQWRTTVYKEHSFASGSVGRFSGLQRLSGAVPRFLRPAVMSVLQYVWPVPFWRVFEEGRKNTFVWLRLAGSAMWLLLSVGGAVCAFRLLSSRMLPRDVILTLTAIAVPVIASAVTFFDVRYRLPAVGPAFLLIFLGFDWRRDRVRYLSVLYVFLSLQILWEIWRYGRY